ncbi:unnamed protein product [Bursaphelenchus xylophilus]|uniref:Serine/threonine-protein kinase PLK n=1 Tax=Bursaphelenchus xylophilus TaxID=6326 RepID=A0A1I7SRH0_BURXY|nr:unnamed protein product [Bursaphelenchus xylophilus]CAG9102413.1 unnamed protein product [Bursaphelenchus xylophilus]
MSPRNIVDGQNGVSYEVIKRLGKGSFATCYLASTRFHTSVDTQFFAIKKFAQRNQHEHDIRFSKIWNEIVVHGRLSDEYRHPNLVSMLAAFTSDEGDTCMLLEYCPNGNLSDFVEQQPKCSLPEPDAARYLKQLLSALDYIHSVHDVLHRDIKPGNVLLTNHARTVKLADFGLACTAEDARRRASVCGTPNYVAPETVLYKGHTYASDYWALGCTFYFMLCGQTPFQTSSIKGTYSRICRGDYGYPRNFGGSRRARDFIDKVLLVNPMHRMSMREMNEHPVLQMFRRNSLTNLHQIDQLYDSSPSHSNGSSHSEHSPPITPNPRNINRCQSMYDVNNNGIEPASPQRSFADSQLVTMALYCSCLTEAWEEQGGLTVIPSDRPLPHNYVAKWVDYTNKFGFGIMMRNGVRSVLFNDDSVLTTIDAEISVYHPLKSHKSASIISKDDTLSQSMEAKIRSLRYVKKYMDTELNSAVPLMEPRSVDAVPLCRDTYVTDIIKLNDSVVFVLSDEAIQINFTSFRLKVVLQRENDQVFLNTVSPNGVFSFGVVEKSLSPIQPPPLSPNWVPMVLDTVQQVMERFSLARHSTKC